MNALDISTLFPGSFSSYFFTIDTPKRLVPRIKNGVFNGSSNKLGDYSCSWSGSVERVTSGRIIYIDSCVYIVYGL